MDISKENVAHRTIELREYILSERVSLDSKEFIPLQAAISLLGSTAQTLKQRISTGELNEKTFFITDPVRKTFQGLEIGGVKRLLILKKQRRDLIAEHVKKFANNRKKTSYADALNEAGMDWKSPPDRKFISKVLIELSHKSYEETIDSGNPCLISAVVVSRNENIPTQSFFEEAVTLGLLEPSITHLEKIEFWEEQLKLVYEIYGR